MENLEIIKQIEEFYNSAWDKLIYAGALAIGIVGVLVPFLIQWWQKRTLALQERTIEQNLKDYVNKAKQEITEEIKQKVTAELKEQLDDQRKFMFKVDGGVFHIQGNNSLKDKLYALALLDFFNAAMGYIKGEDFFNLTRVMTVLKDNVLPHITSDQYEDIKVREGDVLTELIKAVTDCDDRMVFRDTISSIEATKHNLEKKK